MVSVAGEAVAVVQRGGAEVLEHCTGGNHSVEPASFYGCLALCGDYSPHPFGGSERLGNILRLAKVEISLRQYVVEFRSAAVLGLGGLDLIHKPLDCLLLGIGPAPGELPSGMLLDGDYIPFAGRSHGSEALAGNIRPTCLTRVADIAVIIAGGALAVVVFRNGAAAVIHVHHLHILDSSGSKYAREMLDGILGKAVADEEDAEGCGHVQIRIGIDGSIAGGDVVGDILIGGLA